MIPKKNIDMFGKATLSFSYEFAKYDGDFGVKK